MRYKLGLALCALTLVAGCASEPPSGATIAALSSEFDTPKVTADKDCLFSPPVRNAYVANRLNGLCLFNDSQLRLYYGGKKASLAYAWPITDIKSWALHSDIFTVVTDSGNFGMVIKDRAGFIAVLRAHNVPENQLLPEYRAKDSVPSSWM